MMGRPWRQCFVVFLCLLLFSSGGALAVDAGRSYEFVLSVNGKNELNVQPGDILTVTLSLRRSDVAESAEVYALQDEIRYNSSFFSLVEGSLLMQGGVESRDISLQGEERALYVNFVSFSGGEEWAADTILGTFQVRVIGESGTSALQNENCLVSLPDGSDSYAVNVCDFTAVISDECTVCFDPQNGEEVVTTTAALQSLLEEPTVPVWAGHTFTGWYRDKSLAEPWDFANDRVTGNMTLYGAWQESTVEEVVAARSSGDRTFLPLFGAIGCGLLLIVAVLTGVLSHRRKSRARIRQGRHTYKGRH